MDRQVFFDAVRRDPFPGHLTQTQVDGIESLLDLWDKLEADGALDPRWLAYILAGVFHETGRRMVPVREGFADSDAEARAVVAKLYALGVIKQNYARPVNGISYYGRGRIQVTWYDNYLKLEKRFGLPFVANPDLMLDDHVDALVVLVGHIEGLWTGQRLEDFFSATADAPFEARGIVNGDKARIDKTTGKRIGDLVAGYHRAFLAAIRAAAVAPKPPKPPPPPDMPLDPHVPPVQPDLPLPGREEPPERNGPLWAAYVALAAYFGDDPPNPNKETVMVGGILAGAAATQLTRIVAQVVADAVQQAAQRPTNPLNPQTAPSVAVDTAQIAANDPRLREVAARVEHLTNSEPWYQSRVTIGALVAIFSGILALTGRVIAPEVQSGWVDGLMAILPIVGPMIGGGLALIGRWLATKPIGS